jgi:predicted aldo/keto reductase-like oxidoreductase
MELKDISRIGLGGCELPENQEKANELISYALKNGINFFDQGWGYGGAEHKSENILGTFLAENPKIRENIILCDKLPMHEELYNKFGYDGDNIEEVFDKLFEKQLECLNTDYLDIYMIHALDDNKFMTEEKYIAAIKWMQKKKFEGKIKHIGFSAHIDLYKLNYYIDLFEKNFGKGIVDTAMLTYNIFSGSDWVTEQTGINVWTNPGKKGIELCKGHGITVISMMPLESGRALEVSHDKTFTDWCYKFIFDNKFITSTLSGTSNIKHLQQMIDVYNANHNILKKPEEKTVSKKFSKKVIKKESK